MAALLAAPLASTAEARGGGGHAGGGGHGFAGHAGGHGFGGHGGRAHYAGRHGYRGYGYGYDDGGAGVALGILGAVAVGVAASQFGY